MSQSYSKSTTTTRQQLRRQDVIFKTNYPAVYGPNSSNSYYTGRYDTEYETLNGYRNPGWQERVRQGQDANSPLTATRRSLKYTGSSGSASAFAQQDQGWGRWISYENNVVYGLAQVAPPSLNNVPTSLQTKAMNLAKVRFLQQARQAQTAFSGGVYLGEAREAIRMLTGGTRDISKRINRWLYDDVRRPAKRIRRLPRKKRVEEYNSALANQWLQLNYGILPLANDVKSAAEALARLHVDEFEPSVPIRTRGSAKSSNLVDQGTGYKDVWNITYSPSYDVKYLLRDDYEVTVQLRGRVKCKREGVGGVVQYLGLDIQDFVPTVYELIPYSFLLDYFTNVNEIVNAYSFFSSAIEWCWQTVRIRCNRRLDYCELDINRFHSSYSTWWPRRISWTRPTVEWQSSSVSRQNHGSNLVPEFEFEIPGAKAWRKWTNMSALARNSKSSLRFIQRVLN